MADLPKPVPLTQKPATKTKSREARDYGERFRKLRLLRLQKYPLCEICGEAFATIGHHLRRPALSIEDVQSVCLKCHREIHNGKA